MCYRLAFQKAKAVRMKIADGKCEVGRGYCSEYKVECHHKDLEAYGRDQAGTITWRDVIIVCTRCHAEITNVQRGQRYREKPFVTPETLPTITISGKGLFNVEINQSTSQGRGTSVDAQRPNERSAKSLFQSDEGHQR